jgi:orotidine-5'-phosphate decarboxylase
MAMAAFDPGNRLIAAIDAPSRDEAHQLIAKLAGVPAFVKLGLELFCAEGPRVVSDVVATGQRVMLDLKLHDIPETVGRAAARVAGLGAELLTIHASGGRAMMEAAVKGAGATKVLAVTILTSMDAQDLTDVGFGKPVEESVVQLARLAKSAGCAGVVASPKEIQLIRESVGHDFLIVTPGIRPADSQTGDQKRVMTPREARSAGADMIVVGRPLRDAPNPVVAARAVVAELQ